MTHLFASARAYYYFLKKKIVARGSTARARTDVINTQEFDAPSTTTQTETS